ncbi:ATP-binding cassette domain-containing protein [Rhodococcus hoagii]|nr:ATP-binding cassette domain-containing protein [Prescottella equi]
MRGVDLEIAEGEIFGIVGPSGAGKSTLLRCLNLLEQPTSGRIVLRGDDLSQLSGGGLRQARRRIGTVFQQFNLLHSRTVRANVEFPARAVGDGPQDASCARRRADRTRRARRQGEGLPVAAVRGQQQRVGIARALASNPDVLLCDEATSALDPDTTDQVLDLLVELNRSIGVTVVLITHELGVLRRICTSAARLDDGRIAETGRSSTSSAPPVRPWVRRSSRSVTTRPRETTRTARSSPRSVTRRTGRGSPNWSASSTSTSRSSAAGGAGRGCHRRTSAPEVRIRRAAWGHRGLRRGAARHHALLGPESRIEGRIA